MAAKNSYNIKHKICGPSEVSAFVALKTWKELITEKLNDTISCDLVLQFNMPVERAARENKFEALTSVSINKRGSPKDNQVVISACPPVFLLSVNSHLKQLLVNNKVVGKGFSGK